MKAHLDHFVNSNCHRRISLFQFVKVIDNGTSGIRGPWGLHCRAMHGSGMAGGPWRPKGALDPPEGDPRRCSSLQAMNSNLLGGRGPTPMQSNAPKAHEPPGSPSGDHPHEPLLQGGGAYPPQGSPSGGSSANEEGREQRVCALANFHLSTCFFKLLFCLLSLIFRDCFLYCLWKRRSKLLRFF